MSKPVIHYFPLRGRAEVMKLALASVGQEWVNVDVDYSQQKSDREAYPFGQCPRYVDGDINIVQSNAILRYIGRKYNLLGETEAEKVMVDMIMEGVESLRVKYANLIYNDKLEGGSKEAYWSTHLDKASTEARNGGAHFEYLSLLLQKAGGKHFAAKLSMADLALWEIFDLHVRLYGDEVKAMYPELVSFHEHIAGLPGIKEYLASPLRLEKINANNLG